MSDEVWMRRALNLAERGRGHVEPNPLVGAVIVRNNESVGEGWHQRFGHAHAEVNALAQAGEGARGATLYVTLEPCCHHGKTPPCTEAVISAGIVRVVAAMTDPFPQVAGGGTAALTSAGIAVEVGVCEADARKLNAPYLKLLRTGRPYVHAKWAMTLDGKIATRSGDSRWISNESSRRIVHQLRGCMDGILVGVGTACADDPLLTARPPGPRTPCRVVLDSQARLPLASQLVATARQTPTLVVVAEKYRTHAEPLRAAGCEILPLPPGDDGRTDILRLLDELGKRRWTNLLVEGGASVLGAFFDSDAVDAIHVFMAPKFIGSVDALAPIAGRGVDRIADARTWKLESVENLEGDVYLRYLKEGA